MRAGRGAGKNGADNTAAAANSSSKRSNMSEALQAAAATAAANTLGAGVVGKAVMTGAAQAVAAQASCHLPTAATAATATALMGVQKPGAQQQQQQQLQQPPSGSELLKDLVLRGHGLVPPTTATALAMTATRSLVPTPPPLKLRSAPGVEGFANASPEHPLDPLSIQELEAAGLLAGKALAAARQFAEPLEAVRLAEVSLLEPPKQRLVTFQGKTRREALAWGMPRMAQATAFSVASGRTYRVVVDLSAGVSFGVVGVVWCVLDCLLPPTER